MLLRGGIMASVAKSSSSSRRQDEDPVYRYGVWAIETDGWPDATDHSRLTQFNQCYQNPDDDSACARSLSVSEPPATDLMSFHH